MNPSLQVVLAILCNAAAQVLLKLGATPLLQRGQNWQSWLSPHIVAGLALYGLSFYLTVRIYAHFPLSIISPLMAGAVFVLIALASTLLFAETLSPLQLIGIALIVSGIALLARSA